MKSAFNNIAWKDPFAVPLERQAAQELAAANDKAIKLSQKSDIVKVSVRYGAFRQAAVWSFQDVLHLLRVTKWKAVYGESKTFSRAQELPYFESASSEDLMAWTREALAEMLPSEGQLCSRAMDIAMDLDQAFSCDQLAAGLARTSQFYTDALFAIAGAEGVSYFSASESAEIISVDLDSHGEQGRVQLSWNSSMGKDVVTASMHLVRQLRALERTPTFIEFVTQHVAYVELAHAATAPLSFTPLADTHLGARFLGTVGFRPASQTYPSLTDPGDGHVFGTTTRDSWMRGAIVHVEHLERPSNLPRSQIESYRVPSILDFARVRMHTAGDAPNTYFTGRALRDSAGTFAQSFIKVVNTTSSACSQAFSLGAAECKIAMDDLSTSQMVAYMKALSGHSLRNAHQYLSCAMNLNWPLVDDMREDKDGNLLEPVLVTSGFEIAKIGIRVASLGGFDKVTFDGASDSYPSKCIIHQMPFRDFLTVTHMAHEAGLTTYASAGFKFSQIGDGVFAGLDGLGIGGAQILRHMDHTSGMHGPYTEENLDEILKKRDEAAASIRGQGVALLCRMDRMFFEGSLTVREEAVRSSLFEALASVNEEVIEHYLSHPLLKDILAMSDDGERPYAAWSKRLLRSTAEDPVLLRTHASEAEWASLATQLSFALGAAQEGPAKDASREVEADAYDVHVGRVWTTLRARKNADTLSLSRHNDMFRVKTTPFSSNAESRRSSRRSSAASTRPGSLANSRHGSFANIPTRASLPRNNSSFMMSPSGTHSP